MINLDSMIIWVNHRYYFELDYKPVKDDKGEFINNCSLVDSTEKKAIETVAFKSDVILPILKSKDGAAFKKVAEILREVAVKNGVFPVKSSEMPKGKRQKNEK